jgi:hypothetical protein
VWQVIFPKIGEAANGSAEPFVARGALEETIVTPVVMVTELRSSVVSVNRFDLKQVLAHSGLRGVIFFAWIIIHGRHRSIKPASDAQKLRDWTGDLTGTDGYQRTYAGMMNRSILK